MSKNTQIIKKSLKKRYAKERRFRLYGILALTISFSFLFYLLFTITSNAMPAFTQTKIKLEVNLDSKILGLSDNPTADEIYKAKYAKAIRNTLYAIFPEVTNRKQKRDLKAMVSSGASYQLRDMVVKDNSLLNTTYEVWLLADDDIDVFHKGLVDRKGAEADRRLKDRQLAWIEKLEAENKIKTFFNTTLFTAGDSREPEQAGIKSALFGSLFTMLVTLLLSFPIGVAAAVYLEEFAPKNNRWVDLIEVNINNLAAVPSVVFGLLGLAVFINVFGVPRSVPLVGGLVLTIMTLPTIIIASRAAIKSVPPSIREAALGMGASNVQTVFQHVLPLSMPGILTGTIIGMAQALGETAPLLMIGMVAFVVNVPHGILDPSTVLPVQIFLWSDSPERTFVALTSAAIIVLLLFLLIMNILAVLLRKKFERRW